MALDVELLQRAERRIASARVYSWTGPWITLGKFQDPARDLLPTNRVPWIVRPTGGKAVLHGHDVTVALAVPLRQDARSIKPVYRALAAPLIAAMNACGLPAALGEHTRFAGKGAHVADCFAYVSPNDIVDRRTGQKLCGCALQVGKTGALVQASIPVEPPLIDPAAVIVGGKALVAPRWRSDGFAEQLQKALALFANEG